MIIPLTFGYTQGFSRNANAGRCINIFPFVDLLGGKERYMAQGTPGLKQFAQCTPGMVRGLDSWDSLIYAVSGNKFCSINKNTGAVITIGTVNTTTGRAWLKHNANNQMLVVAGETGYLYNRATNAFAKVADTDFPNSVWSCAYLDNYAIVTQRNTAGRLYNSEVNDFSSWTSTDYVTAERNPDEAPALIVHNDELDVFGSETVEFFYTTTDTDAVFQRRPGAVIDVGIGAIASPASLDSLVFWIDNHFNVRVLTGYQSHIISTPQITYQLSQLSDRADAVGFAFTHEGRGRYLITTSTKTFCYDVTETAKLGIPVWYELESYPVSNNYRWRGNCAIEADGNVYIGDFQNGRIYTLDSSTYQDNAKPVKWLITTQPVQDNNLRNNIFHHRLELDLETGVGTNTITNPQVMMRYSDDGGYTWSDELWRDIGSIGEYSERVTWENLGVSRNRIYEFSGTDAVKRSIQSAKLHATMGIH